jgi:hypothetical protein
VLNSHPTLQIEVRGRFMAPDGTVQPLRYIHTPASNATATTEVFSLGEGWLLGLEARATIPPRRGQTFVRLGLARGDITVAGEATQTLAQDYVVGEYTVTWPGGLIRHNTEGPGLTRIVVGTTPGAGNEILETVPTNVRWRVHGVRFSLTTSAAVANRRVRLLYKAPTADYQVFSAADVQAASLALSYNWSTDTRNHGTRLDQLREALPVTGVLLSGHQIGTDTNNLQAGDQFGAPELWVEEWLEP